MTLVTFIVEVVLARSSYVPIIMTFEAFNVIHRRFQLIAAIASYMGIVMAFEKFNI